MEASAEPIEALGPDGVAVLNADDPVVAGYAGTDLRPGRDVRASPPDADVRGQDVAPGRGRTARRSRWSSASRPRTRSRSRCPASTWCRTRSRRRRSAWRSAWRWPGAPTALVAAVGVAVADGDVHHAGRRARRQRRVQREPRIDGGRVAGRAMDGGRRAPHRGARHHGRAGSDRGQGARARSASWRPGSASTDWSRSVRAARRSPTAGVREGVEPDNVACYDDPDRGARRRAAVGAARRSGAVQGVARRGLERMAEALR